MPEAYYPLIIANSPTFTIEQSREVFISIYSPNWTGLGIYTLAATAVVWAGYAWFQKTRKGFADVI